MFFLVRDFHDMRCKHDRVLYIIHQRLNREPEAGDVFIVMSKDYRLVRLFCYDSRSYSLFEERFRIGYKFMKVSCRGEETRPLFHAPLRYDIGRKIKNDNRFGDCRRKTPIIIFAQGRL